MKTILTALLLMVFYPSPSNAQSLTPISISLGAGPTSFQQQRYFEHWKSAYNVGLGFDYDLSNSWAIGADFTFNHATYEPYFYNKLLNADHPTYGPDLTMWTCSATATFLILSRDSFIHPYISVGCGLFSQIPGEIDRSQGPSPSLEVVEEMTRIDLEAGLGAEVRVHKSVAAFVNAQMIYAPIIFIPFTVGVRIGL